MQTTHLTMLWSSTRPAPFRTACLSARPTVNPRNVRRERRVLMAMATPATPRKIDRRGAVGALLALPLLLNAPAALPRDLQAAARAKEERKAQLRAAAQDMKQTGKTEQVFEDSQYSVSEDKTPNIHTRQEEGARTSK